MAGAPRTAEAALEGYDQVAAFAAAVEGRQAEMDRAIDTAGMRRDPFRAVMEGWRDTIGLLPEAVRLLRRPPVALVPEQQELLRADLRKAVEAEARRMVLATDRLRLALYVAVPVLCVAAGWFARGLVPVDTAFGPLSRELVEAFRANNLEGAWAKCVDQPEQGGRAWCKMPMWRSGKSVPRG